MAAGLCLPPLHRVNEEAVSSAHLDGPVAADLLLQLSVGPGSERGPTEQGLWGGGGIHDVLDRSASGWDSQPNSTGFDPHND